METKEEFIIPIDDAIEDFRHHIDAHDRTILSARYGDGKSFFLSHFMENPDVTERYTFLTIFPVNYQVTENRDIFDLIKRDILLQMLLKGVVETDIEITDAEALALYIQCQPLSFIEGFIPLIADISTSEGASRVAAVIVGIKKVFKTLKQKLDVIKQQSDDSRLDQFFSAVEQNPIVGQDAISSIIQKGIKQYKEKHPNKQVALIVEDMDRIDPAHLFRILNVFSAHIDYCYNLGLQPNETLVGNKFGLDKIIFVLHYQNVQNIYSHFYGSETSFEGYIEKFCSSNYFSYSLQEQRDRFFFQRIAKETGLNSELLNYIIKPSDFKEMTIRKASHAFDNAGRSVVNMSTASNNEGQAIQLHSGMLRLIAILRKLGISDSDIIGRLKHAIETKGITSTGLFMYLAPYLNMAKYGNFRGAMRFTKSTDQTNMFVVDNILNDDRALCSFTTSMNFEDSVEESILESLRKVLKMVAK